jgi:hypothetical protein
MANWRSRRRDPAITGIVQLPWNPEDPCPCGGGSRYGRCCGQLTASPYKEIVEFRPPGAPTGYAHPRCYMNWTLDCSRTISGEHFISENVLSILNPKSVRVAGVVWIPHGQTQELPLKALQARILCTRHNSAFSGLDTMAGKLFRAVGEIYDDLDRRTLSRKAIWHLFSGEELELWLLKTILGFFHAGVLSKDGRKIHEVQKIMNPAIEAAYRTGRLTEPCGMYILKTGIASAHRGVLDFASLSDVCDERVVGCRLTIFGLTATFFTDPNMINRDAFTVEHSYRPDYLFYQDKRRRHSIVLTWPPRRSRRAVAFTMASRPTVPSQRRVANADA